MEPTKKEISHQEPLVAPRSPMQEESGKMTSSHEVTPAPPEEKQEETGRVQRIWQGIKKAGKTVKDTVTGTVTGTVGVVSTVKEVISGGIQIGKMGAKVKRGEITKENIEGVAKFALDWLKQKYQQLTTKEVEQLISQLTIEYYERKKGEKFKELPSEKEIDHRIGPTSVTAGTLLAEYALRYVDQNLKSEYLANPEKMRVVLDLGISQPETVEEGEQEQEKRFDIPQEAIDNPDHPYVYLPGIDQFGVQVWLRRDRAKFKEELQYTLKIGLDNLRTGLKKRAIENPQFARNLLANAFVQLDSHMNKYESYVLDKKLSPHVEGGYYEMARIFGNQMHWGLEGATRQQRAAQHKLHDEALVKVLVPLLFPGGVEELPLPAQYREVVLKMVMPAIGANIFEGCITSITTKPVMNKIVLNILESLPKPEELKKSDTLPSPAKPIDPILKAAAGRFFVNILTLAEPDLGSLLTDKLEVFNRLLGLKEGKNIFKQKVEEKMGELMGDLVERWLAQFDSPEDMIDWLMNIFIQNWLGPNLSEEQQAPVKDQSEQVIEKISEVRQNLGPYVTKTFEMTIASVQKSLSHSVDRFFDRVLWKLAPLVTKIKHWFEEGTGVVITFLRKGVSFFNDQFFGFLQWDRQDRLELKVHSDEQARRLLAQLHQSDVHQNLVRNLFDVMVGGIAGKEIESPKV